jgi:hypothetical protein
LDVTYIGPDGGAERVQFDGGKQCWRQKIRFLAEDPYPYTMLPKTLCASEVGDFSLVDGVFQATFDLDYAGDVFGYPIVDIIGPTTNPIINVNGVDVQLTASLAAGQIATVDTRPLVRRAYLGNQSNITTPIDLCWPDIVLRPSCPNAVTVKLPNFLANSTSVCVTHYDRYQFVGC